MKERGQEHRTGAGWVVYWKGMERRSGREGMGGLAEVSTGALHMFSFEYYKHFLIVSGPFWSVQWLLPRRLALVLALGSQL